MAILKEEISRSIKGSLAEREDWWRLCYDTEENEFFVEHEWHHSDAYNIQRPADEGTTRVALEGYAGHGAENLEAAKVELLKTAGHS